MKNQESYHACKESQVKKESNYSLLLLLLPVAFALFSFNMQAQKVNPIMEWNFSEINKRTTTEQISGIADTLEGNISSASGIDGNGLRLDGFTGCLIHKDKNGINPGKEFTIESWVSLGNYPWNWCPVLTTESNETKGYRLMIGPHGEVSLEVAIGGQWISCTTERLTIPLREWIHITGVYRAKEDMSVFINGKLAATLPVQGEAIYNTGGKYKCKIGMVAWPEKPSDIHRTWGTLPQYYGLNGILDEIKVYDTAFEPESVLTAFKAYKRGKPDIQPHRLPTIKNHPGRFGAFYTKLSYYDGWDNLWPVDQDPDIVVCFDKSPVKVIFWRGIRYAASWVTENENWMSDQSVEAWDTGENDKEGCFEHMQDRHCRFSHVRVIENTDARVVVHWRYALVSAYNNTWNVDPKTGWECWIDEYYYIYPDASAIRKVSWKKNSLGYPRQFQETLALIHPGQVISDLLYKESVHVSDYNNNRNKMMYVEDPSKPPYGPFRWDNGKPYTVQQYNYKSQNKPFICFEPGNVMHLRNNRLASYNTASGCNHFPVGQARCDGRTTTTSDRPSHATSFPISDPIIHEKGDRYYWNALYGMNGLNMDDLVEFGRSWAYAPGINIVNGDFSSISYDRSERCYQFVNNNSVPGKLEFTLSGSKSSPVINPAFVIENWNSDTASVLINGKAAEDARIGINHELEGDRLVVFLFLESRKNVEISITP